MARLVLYGYGGDPGDPDELALVYGLGGPLPIFGLIAAVKVSPRSLRAIFSDIPLAINPAGATDALNPANWSVTGPERTIISSLTRVTDNELAIDIHLNGALIAGSWSVNVTGLISTTGVPLA